MNQSDSFGFEPIEDNEFGFEPEKEESNDTLRHIARTGSRIGETVLGLPGDLLNLITNASIYGAEKLKGEPLSPKFKETFKETAPFKLLPTSEKIRESISEATGGYTEPQSETEETGDEITQLATAVFSPGKDPSKFKSLVTGLGKALGKATAAVGAKETAKGFGATPGQQSAAEIGTLMLASLIKPGSANKYAGELYKDAQSQIPRGVTINTVNLTSRLAKTKTELLKGDMTATKKKVLSSLENLEKKAAIGKISPSELTDFYKDVNETLSSNNLFDQFAGLSKSERKLLRQRYDMLRNDIRDTLKEYGKINPKFYNSWSKANEVYSTVAQSKRLSNFIMKHAPKGIAGALFGAVEFPGAIAPVAKVLGAGYVGLKSGEIMYRISKSPELRKHYSDIVKFALEENVSAMNQSLKKLEKGLETFKSD